MKKAKRNLPPADDLARTWDKSVERYPQIVPESLLNKPCSNTSTTSDDQFLSYDTAYANGCREVNAIIERCKASNTKYRDYEFDIQKDLFFRTGNTLNGFGETAFDLKKPASVPRSARRLQEIFPNPTFMRDINANDVEQGKLNNCGLIAAFSAVAQWPGGIKRLSTRYDIEVGVYGFLIFRDNEWVHVTIDDFLFLRWPNWNPADPLCEPFAKSYKPNARELYEEAHQTGSTALFFGKNTDFNETWVPLLEKAQAKGAGDYASQNDVFFSAGVEALTGGVLKTQSVSDILNQDIFWSEVCQVKQKYLFACGIMTGSANEDRQGICTHHQYLVLRAETLKAGIRVVCVRNPWGKKDAIKDGIWGGPWSGGSKEWSSEAIAELSHQQGTDSNFWSRLMTFFATLLTSKEQHLPK